MTINSQPLTQSGEAPLPDVALPQLREMVALVVGTHPLHQSLQRICVIAAQGVPSAAQVSVTLLQDPAFTMERSLDARTVAFSGALALHLDERQYQDGSGPCMDAAMSGTTIHVDTATGDYPDFCEAARTGGVRHLMSLGLPFAQRVIGALNVYGADRPFDDADQNLAETFAHYVGAAVANHRLYASAVERGDHLEIAMKSRAVIEQAKGILMAQRRCPADEAFAILRALSRDTNRKLRDVAQALVDHTTAPVRTL